MSKATPPLLGFNNNVRHRGRIFHIQTEDSGVKFPRIVTHLFADGGRIVRTTRTDYSEHLQQSDMATVVRGMMKEQHKAMFATLRAGGLDQLLEDVCGPLEAAKTQPVSRPPENLTARSDLETARVVVGSTGHAQGLPAPTPATSSEMASDLGVAAAAAASTAQPVADAQAVLKGLTAVTESDALRREKRSISNPNLRRPTPSVAPPPADAFDLDVASLDKNPPKSTLTPPPPNLRPARKSNPAPRKSRPPIPQRPAAAPVAVAAADGASASLPRPQARPAAAPQTNARSIFGDGAISEQSLDEVILSYLAEDLDETK